MSEQDFNPESIMNSYNLIIRMQKKMGKVFEWIIYKKSSKWTTRT